MPRRRAYTSVEAIYAGHVIDKKNINHLHDLKHQLADVDDAQTKLLDHDHDLQSVLQSAALCKFGWENITWALEVYGTVPAVWPLTVRQSILGSHLSETQKETLTKVGPWLHVFTRTDSGTSKLQFVGPPTGTCYGCDTNLSMHNQASQIKYVHSSGRVMFKKKVTLRCIKCQLNYHFDKFGNRSQGYRFYDQQQDSIVATDGVIIDRVVYNLQCALSQHAWVSFSGFAESWHDAHSIKKEHEIDRRVWAEAFWWGEVEDELRRRGRIDFPFHSDADRLRCMEWIDDQRKTAVYPHPPVDCTEECQARGCGKLWVTDGIWKTQFAHCMFVVKNELNGLPLVNFPDVCTNAPMPGMAFCAHHCHVCETQLPPIPTGLRQFNAHIGSYSAEQEEVVGNPVDVAEVLGDHRYSRPAIEEMPKEKVIYQEGTVHSILSHCEEIRSQCKKDIGERPTLRMMSRGHQFVVRGGGHIDAWTPLFKSESPGQVFLFLLTWLYWIVKDLPVASWSSLWLAYDNMCQLDKMKAATKKLPLPPPFDAMWLRINKIIDSLHISNHKDVSCHTDYHPDNFTEMYPALKSTKNTQAAEQTFVWLGRFKRIVCSMTKTHHLFFLHRMVSHRNAYTAKCYLNGRKPLLPGIRNKFSS